MFVVRSGLLALLLATLVVAGCEQKSDHEQPAKIVKPDQVKITLGNPPAAAETPPAATPAEDKPAEPAASAPAETSEAAAATPATPPAAEAKPAEPAAEK